MFTQNIGLLPTPEQIISTTFKDQYVTFRMINTPTTALRIRLQTCRDARYLAELTDLLIHVNRTRVASCDQITTIKTVEKYLSPYLKLRRDDLQYEYQDIKPPSINFSTIRMSTDDNLSINTQYVRRVSRDRCAVTIHLAKDFGIFRCEFRSVANASRFVGYVNRIKVAGTPTQAQFNALVNDERVLRCYLRPRNEEVILKEVRELLHQNRRARKITDNFLSTFGLQNCQEPDSTCRLKIVGKY